MENLAEPLLSRWKWPLAAGFLFVAAWLGYRWVHPSYQAPTQPVPNGYMGLLELSDKLARRTGWYDQMPDHELQFVVTANEPYLAEARKTLRNDCVVALDWHADRQWFENVHLKSLSQMKELSRAFAAEGLLAIKHGDSRAAINSGLENLHLAKAFANGGLGTDWLSGIAAYTVGLMTLRDACEIATAADCQFVLGNLPEARHQFELPRTITDREWHFFRRVNGAWSTFVSEMAFSNNRRDFENRMEISLLTARTREQLLRLHYAIRGFALAEGRLPKSLAELAGKQITKVPLDPCGDRQFIYQVAADNYLLYSVGPNGIDDGGAEDQQNPSRGDLLLPTRLDSAATTPAP